jgi:general secretion pathway protein H
VASPPIFQPTIWSTQRMNDDAESGFTLLEMVCVLAIIAMLAAVLLPLIPRQTSRSRLQAYALEAATLLKADRNAAIRRQGEVATFVDAGTRSIHSGATTETIRIPDDVQFDALLPQRCRQRAALSTISFFANGMSCGGTIALTRLDAGYEVRVNWLTGRIEIVSHSSATN